MGKYLEQLSSVLDNYGFKKEGLGTMLAYRGENLNG
jgi:hypothetical protein